MSSLPASLGRLTRLRRLHVAHNRLQKLPAELSTLTGLQELQLEGNKLQSLPPELLKSVSQLQVLNLENNELSSLPIHEFACLTCLRTLRLGGNRFDLSPQDVISLLADIVHSAETLRELSLRDISLKGLSTLKPPSSAPVLSSSEALDNRPPPSPFNYICLLKGLKVTKVLLLRLLVVTPLSFF